MTLRNYIVSHVLICILILIVMWINIQSAVITYEIYEKRSNIKIMKENIREKKRLLNDSYGLKKIQAIYIKKILEKGDSQLVFPSKETTIKKYISESKN